MITKAHVYEELANIVAHEPLFAGDTISHHTANYCVEMGFAYRDYFGKLRATDAGRDALLGWLAERMPE